MLNVLKNTFDWFVKARPNPISKDIHSQLGVHFEEVVEMIKEIESIDRETDLILSNAYDALHTLANHLKKNDGVIVIREANRLNFLDSIADQLVTATGVAYTLHMDPVGALNAVNDSNYSKFDADGNPIFDPDTKKVLKGPNYFKADLSPFV